MKGRQHPTNDVSLNPSANESILDVIARTDLARRTVLKTGIGAGALAAAGGVTLSGIVQAVEKPPAGSGVAPIGFRAVPPNLRGPNGEPPADRVEVPPGYTARVLVAWGDPLFPNAPAWRPDASQDAAAQELQFGMHNDGLHFFPYATRRERDAARDGHAVNPPPDGVAAGVLCVNNEYTHESILHPRGLLDGADQSWATGLPGERVTIAKVRKSQAAHGASVMTIRRTVGRAGRGSTWTVARSSPLNRRITANTPMRVGGPAAGHALLKSKRYEIRPDASVDTGTTHDGRTAYGTYANCSQGHTPWGTWLTCEENWHGYFAAPGQAVPAGTPDALREEILADRVRYGIDEQSFGYRWHLADPRFDAAVNPLEPNLFGYVVEIDPYDPQSRPVKRTALGRFKHESAQVAVDGERRVAFYMGDDERNEYVYKFVCARPLDADRRRNLEMLDDGTLYVAQFTAAAGSRPGTYRGRWIPLRPDTETRLVDPQTRRPLRLRDLPLFRDVDDAGVLAKICIRTRQAADAVGATMMDRPEWTALRTYYDPGQRARGYPVYDAQRPLEVYCTLTNNHRRGGGDARVRGATSAHAADGTTAAESARPPVDVANPRPDNDYGHIIRWREDGNLASATGFEWDIFVLAGDSRARQPLSPAYAPTNLVDGRVGEGAYFQGNVVADPPGSADFGAPDGLWFDWFGRLWVQTDQQGDGTDEWVHIGTNMMVCADPNTKQFRRFLTSPPQSEVTGVVTTPDGTAMFVGIQHPGEEAPASNPRETSNWPQNQYAANSAGERLPDSKQHGRPRSAVIVITKDDGGVIGS